MTTPTNMTAIPPTLSAVALSPKYQNPMRLVPNVPSPDHTAYVTDKSITLMMTGSRVKLMP